MFSLVIFLPCLIYFFASWNFSHWELECLPHANESSYYITCFWFLQRLTDIICIESQKRLISSLLKYSGIWTVENLVMFLLFFFLSFCSFVCIVFILFFILALNSWCRLLDLELLVILLLWSPKCWDYSLMPIFPAWGIIFTFLIAHKIVVTYWVWLWRFYATWRLSVLNEECQVENSEMWPLERSFNLVCFGLHSRNYWTTLQVKSG